MHVTPQEMKVKCDFFCNMSTNTLGMSMQGKACPFACSVNDLTMLTSHFYIEMSLRSFVCPSVCPSFLPSERLAIRGP